MPNNAIVIHEAELLRTDRFICAPDASAQDSKVVRRRQAQRCRRLT
jgi:hypothetical protein